jgi:hypothetical protein
MKDLKMKTYKPLPIPEDSDWDRTTLFGRLHWRIRNFLTSCNNLIKWFPTIWNDRDWDGHYTLKILQKKIEFQRKELVNANRHTRIDIDNRDMTLVLNLLERVREEHYHLECMDYWDSDYILNEIPNKPNSKSLEVNTTAERYDEYLLKYPSSVRAITKEHGEELDKQRLCLMVSNYNHKKANKLLFRVLEERLAFWWD